MDYRINITERLLHFKNPAGTSRGVYNTRRSWFLELTSKTRPGCRGVGECAPLPALSCDDIEDYGDVLRRFCDQFERTGVIDDEDMKDYPSMLFGLETAIAHFNAGNEMFFDTSFSRCEAGIPINGLVWMGSFEEMRDRIEEKINNGFRCIKLKIGSIDFDKETELIRHIRKRFGKDTIELRVDANGAFTFDEAPDRLEVLARYDIHSIEQPIKAGQWDKMAELCRYSPLPVALDEELIGVNDTINKKALLDTIKPAYIILKPSLHGGMKGTREWVSLARKRNIGSWMTSALESNVGLNAIAQLTADIYGSKITMPQGLGTGLLFTDNIPMPIEIRKDMLWSLKSL